MYVFFCCTLDPDQDQDLGVSGETFGRDFCLSGCMLELGGLPNQYLGGDGILISVVVRSEETYNVLLVIIHSIMRLKCH